MNDRDAPYDDGLGVMIDMILTANDADSHFRIALANLEGSLGLMQSDWEGIRRLKIAVDMGHQVATWLLACIHYTGAFGETRDLEEAFRLFKLSVDSGYLDSFLRLGMMYLLGEGVDEDFSTASEYFRMGADRGHADCQFCHAQLLSAWCKYSDAMRYYEMASVQNHTGASYKIGMMYLNGTGFRRDPAAAALYFTMASNRNDKDAQFELANLYSKGEGVDLDLAEASRLYILAARRGQEDALKVYREAKLGVKGEHYKPLLPIEYDPNGTNLPHDLGFFRKYNFPLSHREATKRLKKYIKGNGTFKSSKSNKGKCGMETSNKNFGRRVRGRWPREGNRGQGKVTGTSEQNKSSSVPINRLGRSRR